MVILIAHQINDDVILETEQVLIGGFKQVKYLQ